jgi:hypothetical protein
MNIPDQISETLETIYWVKIFRILLCGSGLRDRKYSDPGSGLNIPDPQQHYFYIPYDFIRELRR